ncbi:MAG: hypothetical protein AABW73_04800 [Nanoarchaeota archaeon]
MSDSYKSAIILVGVLFILLGLISAKYSIVLTEENLLQKKTYTEKPYESYSIPLMIAGIALVIVGAAMSGRETVVRERVITKRREED